jgi:hypothetical protein
MTDTRPDATEIRVYSTYSARLHRIAGEVMSLRKQADNSRSGTSSEIDRVKHDPTLSEEGKTLELDQIKERERPALKNLRDQEVALLESEARELDRRLDGIIGYAPSDLVAYRDAQDRAEALTDGDHAKRVMARALRSEDRTLAHAVYRRALEAGWNEPLADFKEKYPEAAGVANDLRAIRNLIDEGGFQRAVAYSPVSNWQ